MLWGAMVCFGVLWCTLGYSGVHWIALGALGCFRGALAVLWGAFGTLGPLIGFACFRVP